MRLIRIVPNEPMYGDPYIEFLVPDHFTDDLIQSLCEHEMPNGIHTQKDFIELTEKLAEIKEFEKAPEVAALIKV